jgi:hypothetical protein
MTMASKQTYECYVCRRNGLENVRVYLDGKTEDGKTIYKNEDMTPHAHKLKQSINLSTGSTQESGHLGANHSQNSSSGHLGKSVPQNSSSQPQQQQSSKTIVTQATKEERILTQLNDLNIKIDHLTKLVYTLSQQQKPEEQHNNPHTLLDNR